MEELLVPIGATNKPADWPQPPVGTCDRVTQLRAGSIADAKPFDRLRGLQM